MFDDSFCVLLFISFVYLSVCLYVYRASVLLIFTDIMAENGCKVIQVRYFISCFPLRITLDVSADTSRQTSMRITFASVGPSEIDYSMVVTYARNI